MKKVFIHMIYIFFLFISMWLVIMSSLIYPSEFETIKNTILIENYVEDNNLNMPFPNWVDLPNNEIMVNNLMNTNIYDFHEILIKNYQYDELYDCKYWAYVWANYWKYNSNKYDLKVIKTDNHIFTILFNETQYCIADQLNLNCVELIQ